MRGDDAAVAFVFIMGITAVAVAWRLLYFAGN